MGKIIIKAESPNDSNNDVNFTLQAKVKSLRRGCFCCREVDGPYLLIERARNPPENLPLGGITKETTNINTCSADMIPVVKTDV